jgi:hypothetical protein
MYDLRYFYGVNFCCRFVYGLIKGDIKMKSSTLGLKVILALALSSGLHAAKLIDNVDVKSTNKRGFNKSYRNTVRSKHKRHQGAREIARRALQVERGILKTN